jgi:FkbM family methyltransferase
VSRVLHDEPQAAGSESVTPTEHGPVDEMVSLLRAAALLEPDAPAEEVIAAYLRAWEKCPTRAEPLALLARFCRHRGRYALGRAFAAQGLQIPHPGAEAPWVDENVYGWMCLDEFAVCSYWTGEFRDSVEACRELLERRPLPATEHARVAGNLAIAQAKLPASESTPRIPRPAPPADDLVEPTTQISVDPLWAMLAPRRRTAVVDVGANPTEGAPAYDALLSKGLCTVVGFEPNPQALSRLAEAAGAAETYLPWALGDGARHTLHVCAAEAMTSLLPPDPVALDRFHLFGHFAAVVGTVEVDTRRLDDLTQLGPIDLLKVAVQGSELSVVRSGRVALRDTVAIHTDVSFMSLYQGQPTFGEVDAELRAAGFVPHLIAEVKRWPLAPLVLDGDPRKAANQLLDADVVYVRDLTQAGRLTDEQLKHLALIAHHCYGSYDLAAQCLHLLVNRGVLASGAIEVYCALLSTLGVQASTFADSGSRDH